MVADNRFMQGEYEGNEQIMAKDLSLRDQRALVFHLLYSADAFDYGVSFASIVDNFGRGYGIIINPTDHVFSEAHDIIERTEELDLEVKPLLEKWRFDRLGVCTRLILRIGVWEMKYTKTDSTVVINEAVELAKCFAEGEAYKFVNGILDEWNKRREGAPEEAQ